MAKKKETKVADSQLTKPQSRLERYLGTIAGLFSDAPSDPRTRLERYLDAIVRGGGGGAGTITPDTTTSVSGLLYGNAQNKIEGVASGMTVQEIEGYLEAVQTAVGQGGVPGFSQLVRPNLLDNAYFVGGGSQQGGGQFPINQRAGYVVPDGVTYYSDDALTTEAGTTSTYTTAVYVNTTYGTIDVGDTTYYVAYGDMAPGYVGAGYGIDRWLMYGDWVIEPASIKCAAIGNSIVQKFENPSILDGKTLTASVLYGDGSLSSGTATYALGERVYFVSHDVVITQETTGEIQAWVGNPAATIAAVKLELGDAQTLAHQENGVWVLNEIPNFQQELAKCQRYYFKRHWPQYASIGNFYGKGTWINLPIGVGAQMRSTPIPILTGKLGLITNAAIVPAVISTFTNSSTCGTLQNVGISVESISEGASGYVFANDPGGVDIEFDANL